MLFKRIKGDPQARLYDSRCEYCGSLFIKFAPATKYCSDKCRHYANLEHTEKRVRKHRLNHSKSDKYWGLGSGYLHGKPKSSFNDEHKSIINEMKRLKLLND